jgi:hypothetical protein
VEEYSTTTLLWAMYYPLVMRKENNKPLTVVFVQGDLLLASGAHEGGICIWRSKTGETAQVLPLEGKSSPNKHLRLFKAHYKIGSLAQILAVRYTGTYAFTTY